MPLKTKKWIFTHHWHLDNFFFLLYIRICTNGHLVVQWKNYTVNMSLHLSTKQQMASSFEKHTTWIFWRVNWILRVHMYQLHWRKTNFFISNVNCLHLIRFHRYTKILTDKSRFISNSSHCFTTILSKHIISTLTSVKDHVINFIGTAFSNSNDNYFVNKNLFWSHREVATTYRSGFSSTFYRHFHFIHLFFTWFNQSKSVVSC